MEKQKMFELLERHRLEKYYNKFLEMGIESEEDFLDSVTEKNLEDIGLSQVEKNRFVKLTESIKRMSIAKGPQVNKSLQSYLLYYTFFNCPEVKEIRGMDPNQNTVEDLMLRICYEENIGSGSSVCLFTTEGLPLTDDPFFNTWSLNDRHIENESKLYAVFTPKENLRESPQNPQPMDIRNQGSNTVRCHIMLRGTYEIKVDLENDTLSDLRKRLMMESGIPAHVIYFKYSNYSETLESLGISEDETVYVTLTSFPDLNSILSEVFHNSVKPSVPQSQKGLSIFYSSLQAISIVNRGEEFKKVIAYIRELSGCHSLAQSLYQLICRATPITGIQKISLVEGLYFLFRELLPSLTKRCGDKIIEDGDVFEHSTVCWAYLISQGQNKSIGQENYAVISLKALSTDQRFFEPVRVPGLSEVFDRKYIMDVIKYEEKIPNCSEERLRETSLQRATDVEKILLSLPQSFTRFPLWISHDSAQTSYRINPEKTYAEMNELLKMYPHIDVTPPLQLKNLGVEGPKLVHLSEENVGLYITKDKMIPQNIRVFDFLSGKEVTVSADELANRLRDVTADLTFRVTKTPKEAIVVLFDSSSSMSEECFDDECQMKRIDAIKQVFDSFSNRCMAYNFDHVICLVKFDSKVTTLHTFTENLETFKEHVHGLTAVGRTLLYDALNHGSDELNKVKERFPDCRCRILCLTDGNDYGSVCKPVDTAKKLMISNIIVDAVIVGKHKNMVLHGISNVTGGCCFKPGNIKAAVQLFEMETVLSLELRKEKQTFSVSSVTNEKVLKMIFLKHQYDEKPETKLPPQINQKVTVTQNVLKKKIMESKSGHFLEKDRRMMEELKSLHCDPHPYCTVLPLESDLSFWKVLMQGPPDTPYENGVFELYCEFGKEYPVKPPLVRFLTPVYHCNVNSVGRICHNIFDRNYSSQITMREILDAVYGLLIIPEPEDPLDSVLAEEYLTSKDKYEAEARKNTEKNAGSSMDEAEKKYVPELNEVVIPQNLKCFLTKKLFVDPVKTKEGCTYERKAIEEYLKKVGKDPQTNNLLQEKDLKEDRDMKKMVQRFRKSQI
ncbi:uncharacterized protein [Hoplias malabaricus]|uniref:uncharacterized protein n=1 Tax=Hoplias malabaricus TaxID=27720 RepID=UPI003461FEE6